MTYVLILTALVWTGNGLYKATKVERPYRTEVECVKAKNEALQAVGDREGVIARCEPREAR